MNYPRVSPVNPYYPQHRRSIESYYPPIPSTIR